MKIATVCAQWTRCASDDRDVKEKGLYAIALSCLFLLSFYLNSMGARFGLPHFVCWDEAVITVPAFNMIKHGSFDIESFIYPCLFIYVMTVVFALIFFVIVIAGRWSIPNPIVQAISRSASTWTGFYFGGRLFAALLGTATAILTYIVGKRFFSKRAALIGAYCLAVSPLLVQQSHVILPNVFSVLFILIAVHYSLKILETGLTREIFLAGLFSGIAAAAKYNGGPVVIAGIAAVMLARRFEKWLVSCCILFIGFLLGLFSASPHIVLDVPRFLNDLGFIFELYRTHAPALSELPIRPTSYAELLSLWCLGKIPSILALCGFMLSLLNAKTRRACLVIGAFTFSYYACASIARIHMHRHMLPILPFLALYCGYALDSLMAFVSKVARRKESGFSKFGAFSVNALLLFAVFYGPLRDSRDVDLDLLKPDSRNRAWGWIKDNTPFQSAIIVQTRDMRDFEEGGYSDTAPVVPGLRVVKNIDVEKPISLLDLVGYDYLLTIEPSRLVGNRDVSAAVTLLKEWCPLNSRDPTIQLWRIKEFNFDVVETIEGKDLTFTDPNVVETIKKGGKLGFFMRNDQEGYFDIRLQPGGYTLYVKAKAFPFQTIYPIMRAALNDVKIAEQVIGSDEWGYYAIDFTIKKEGINKISLSLINDFYLEGAGDVNFFVESLFLAKKR